MKKLILIYLSLSIFSYGNNGNQKLKDLKKGEKRYYKIRENLNESLELKVSRSKNNTKARIAAAGEAFEIGEDRLYFIKNEEKEIKQFNKEIGINDSNNLFLGQKYDKIYKEFNKVKKEIGILEKENKKLREYDKKLREMEQINSNNKL